MMLSFAYMLKTQCKVYIYIITAINGRYFQLIAVTPTAALSPPALILSVTVPVVVCS